MATTASMTPKRRKVGKASFPSDGHDPPRLPPPLLLGYSKNLCKVLNDQERRACGEGPGAGAAAGGVELGQAQGARRGAAGASQGRSSSSSSSSSSRRGRAAAKLKPRPRPRRRRRLELEEAARKALRAQQTAEKAAEFAARRLLRDEAFLRCFGVGCASVGGSLNTPWIPAPSIAPPCYPSPRKCLFL